MELTAHMINDDKWFKYGPTILSSMRRRFVSQVVSKEGLGEPGLNVIYCGVQIMARDL